MRTRRDFISLAGKGLGLAALSSVTIGSLLRNVEAAAKTIAHLTPEEAASDEDYWATIQNSFSVTRGIINQAGSGENRTRQISRRDRSGPLQGASRLHSRAVRQRAAQRRRIGPADGLFPPFAAWGRSAKSTSQGRGPLSGLFRILRGAPPQWAAPRAVKHGLVEVPATLAVPDLRGEFSGAASLTAIEQAVALAARQRQTVQLVFDMASMLAAPQSSLAALQHVLEHASRLRPGDLQFTNPGRRRGQGEQVSRETFPRDRFCIVARRSVGCKLAGRPAAFVGAVVTSNRPSRPAHVRQHGRANQHADIHPHAGFLERNAGRQVEREDQKQQPRDDHPQDGENFGHVDFPSIPGKTANGK